jgi:hypothetical protein
VQHLRMHINSHASRATVTSSVLVDTGPPCGSVYGLARGSVRVVPPL